ncbi:MAG: PIG-L deacetylase family protein [Bryobacteraceae bacterium]
MIGEYLRQMYRTVLPLLYARSKFKLFLKAGLGDIDLRMLALASQTDYFSNFVRPVPIRAPFGKSMVVVAPHQDDEAIGCGGVLALQLRSGQAASIVVLQDGADRCEQLGYTRQAMMEMRNDESRRAAAAIAAPPPIFLNHPVLAEDDAQIAELAEILVERKADAVFIPFPLDGHRDHRTANYILAGALRKIPWQVRVFGYEVWGLSIPNVIVVIDDAVEAKTAMLQCYTFANSALDYVNSTLGLNMFHSRMLGAGECRYAERFFELPREEYIELAGRIRAAELAAAAKA